MEKLDDTLIPVQREWNAWRTAGVRLGDLEAVHWLQPNGAPVPLIHAYVACTSFVTGSIQHGCEGTAHRLLVCVVKCHVTPGVHAELARRAGHQPHVPAGGDTPGVVPSANAGASLLAAPRTRELLHESSAAPVSHDASRRRQGFGEASP